MRFPIFKQQVKERSSLLFPRKMTLVLSHSMSPPGHPPHDVPPIYKITAWMFVFWLTSSWEYVKIYENIAFQVEIYTSCYLFQGLERDWDVQSVAEYLVTRP